MQVVRSSRLVAVLAGAVLAASCGVRAPAPIDVAALVARRGPVEARRDLEIRILAEPRDVQARLALAELADQLGSPSDAIDQLEAVERLGGPVGTRWHAADRTRFGRLLAARGRARLVREAASALGDLERARQLGARVAPEELARARAAGALAELRHVDAEERAKGRATVATLASEPAWAGARPHATPTEHAAFGVWLWARGANREAYDQLARWHDATPLPRDATLEAAFERAVAWWSPDVAVEVLSRPAPAPPPGVPGPDDEPTTVVATQAALDAAGPDPRATAVARFTRARLVAIVAAGRTGTAPAAPLGPSVLAAARIPDEAALVAIARAFRRDPAVAERLARELVGRSIDSALGDAAAGALFDALGDPARARMAWLAASTDSDEPAIVAGYASAAARAGDGDAALVSATGAAAASGDPAIVWLDVGHALMRGHRPIDALTTMRTAIDLAGANALAATLDLAIAASHQVGRDAQADALAARRAQLEPPPPGHAAERVELAELAQHAPNASVLAAVWVATRAAPIDIELRAALVTALDRDDPRRATLIAELVALAGAPDPDRGLAACLALR